MAEAYLDAKFHLNPSSRLTTVHERHRQVRQTDKQTDRQTGQRSDSIGRPFYKRGRPKMKFGRHSTEAVGIILYVTEVIVDLQQWHFDDL